MIRLWIAGALLLALGLALPAAASEEGDSRSDIKKGIEKKDTLWLRGKGLKHVQLLPMMAPVQKPSGRSLGSTAVTVVLEIPNADDVAKVCRLSPRVQDAIVAEMYRHPIVFENRKLKLDEAGANLVAPVNGAVEGEPVSKVFIFQGAHSMGAGSLGKLPFASVLGCRELKVNDKKKEKEEEGGH